MRIALVVSIVVLASSTVFAQDGSGPSADESAWIARLFERGLTDPTGKTFVWVQVTVRSCWAYAEPAWRWGWLAPEAQGAVARVHFLEHDDWIAAPPTDQRRVPDIGFVEQSRAMADADATARTQTLPMPIAARVAWLHRLGHTELAARLLRRARSSIAVPTGEPAATGLDKLLGLDLGWSAFDRAVNAFILGADHEALRHVERLARRYPAELDAYGAGTALLADLRRREAAGTLGCPVLEEPPAEVAGWPIDRRVAWLIAQLDQCQARQWTQPDEVSMASDWRVAALIEIGEPAVPALIDVIDSDERLTRSIHFWRDFDSNRTLLTVREAAHEAVTSILRTRAFDPRGTGDSFSARGREHAKAAAERLRAYWKEYGGRPFARRMYDVLVDSKAAPDIWLEAATNLAALPRDAKPTQPHPAIDAFREPTTAQAMVAAMDRHLAVGFEHDFQRRHARDGYLGSLIALGDTRVVPDLVRRAADASRLDDRVALAQVCFRLGTAGPLSDLAAAFAAGTLALPDGNRLSLITAIVGAFALAGTAEADRALEAIAREDHPAHGLVRDYLLQGSTGTNDYRALFMHRYCLAVLRRALDDGTASGVMYRRVSADRVHEQHLDWSREGALPEELAGEDLRADAIGRRCDLAAAAISSMVYGTPAYHPLLRDAEARLASLRQYVDRYRDRMRCAEGPFVPRFVPLFPRLDRLATADDVDSGRAVFHQGGEGRVAPPELVLPCIAQRRAGPNERAGRDPVYVVQAEIGPDGALYYGVVWHRGMQRLRADALERVHPWEGR